MRKHIIGIAIVIASIAFSTALIAQPGGGFNKTAPIQGTGSSGSPIAITACSSGSGYVRNGTSWACALIGDITGITAGNGLSGDATSGAASLSVNTGAGISIGADTLTADATYLQRRISTDCGAGSAVRSVAEDGTPTCIAAGGTITAGTNIDVSGSTVSVEPSVTLAGDSATTTLDVYGTGTGEAANGRKLIRYLHWCRAGKNQCSCCAGYGERFDCEDPQEHSLYDSSRGSKLGNSGCCKCRCAQFSRIISHGICAGGESSEPAPCGKCFVFRWKGQSCYPAGSDKSYP